MTYGGAAVGDLIQWEVDGVLELEKPTCVRAVQPHEGKEWVFVEGSEAGIPMDQVIVEQKGAGDFKSPIAPPRLRENAPAGTRKLVMPLMAGGEATLSFPEQLSPDGFEELKAYLDVLLGRAKNHAEKRQTAIAGLARELEKEGGAETGNG